MEQLFKKLYDYVRRNAMIALFLGMLLLYLAAITWVAYYFGWVA